MGWYRAARKPLVEYGSKMRLGLGEKTDNKGGKPDQRVENGDFWGGKWGHWGGVKTSEVLKTSEVFLSLTLNPRRFRSPNPARRRAGRHHLPIGELVFVTRLDL